MNLDLLSRELDIFYRSLPTNIFTEIPAGTGICHIANVAPYCWKSGFVSRYEGRWKLPGEYKKHFGDAMRTCGLELFGGPPANPDQVICELWEAQKDFYALDISKFPQELQVAFYEGFGPAPKKWEKPNLAITKFYEYPFSRDIYSVYAPSASGSLLGVGGMVLLTNPLQAQVSLVQTGIYGQLGI